MLILKKIVCLVFLFNFITFAQAETPEASNTLSSYLKNMRSMQANFSQTIVDNKGQALQKATGQVLLQRPSQFRWDVLKPNRQLVVTNGKKLWIYDPDLEQVTIRSLVKAAGETPAMLLSDEDLSLTKEFFVKMLAQNKDGFQWFNLVPKDKSSMLSSLRLGFANQQIKQMQLQDHLGHRTIIEFTNIHTNLALSPSSFNFKPPAHIDIIDETTKR